MTVENTQNAATQATNPKKIYDCVVTFVGPQEGVMRIRASSPEEARELITKQLANREKVEIVDVYDAMEAELEMAQQYKAMQDALDKQGETDGNQIPEHLLNPKLAN